MLSDPQSPQPPLSEISEKMLGQIAEVQRILDRSPDSSANQEMKDYLDRTSIAVQEAKNATLRLERGHRAVPLTDRMRNVVTLLAVALFAALAIIYFR